MRKHVALAATIVLAATACAGGGRTRTVFVDYSHDEFASFFVANFPAEVAVHPGDELIFKQTWTGEPHTVTGGTKVDEIIGPGRDWLPFFNSYQGMVASGVDIPDPENPGDAKWSEVYRAIEESDAEPLRTKFINAFRSLRKSGADLPPPGSARPFADVAKSVEQQAEKLFGTLPFAFGEDEFELSQNIGQPCYLTSGLPPKASDDPCRSADQRQPPFDGTSSYYNSGIIPYEGPSGNTFNIELSGEIKPGDYFFYCAVHGPGQSTKVTVKPRSASIPSAEAVNRQAREEIERYAEPYLELYKDAKDGRLTRAGQQLTEPFAGLGGQDFEGSINEFMPRTMTVKAGRKVTWKIVGTDHTVSFSPPKYFPIIRFAENGNVSINPKLRAPAGGSPKIPEVEEGKILSIDGGTYDGSGFFSSGLFGGEPYAEYSLRFSKPGRYRYACLIHPPMVGTVVVTP